MNTEADYPNWHFIPQAPSSYEIHVTCQIENLGSILEQLPKPFGIFDTNYRGTFVEVGAFDGQTYSNVWGLAKANWNGIMVEPMPENFSLCQAEHKTRPWIIIEPIACSDRDDDVINMFFEREGSRIANDNEAHHKIRTMTLDSILKKHGWEPDFDLLVIDTEHFELPVLKGFNLELWKPKLAIVETHMPYRPIIHEIFTPLYRIYSEDGLNTLFVRKDWCKETST